MTVDDSHPELFPEEAGVGSGVLPPFEELFDTPEFSLKLLESLISVAVDPATPEPEVDLIPGDSTDPGVASDPGEDELWGLGEPGDDHSLGDSPDLFDDLDQDPPVTDNFPGEDPLAGM